MALYNFTDDNYASEVLDYKGYVLIDFWAPWCGPCRALTPKIEEYAQEMEGQLKVGKINIDDNPAIASQFGVRSIPTLVLIKDGAPATRGGAPVEAKLGNLSKSEIDQWVQSVINQKST